jgi:hypothetical protein
MNILTHMKEDIITFILIIALMIMFIYPPILFCFCAIFYFTALAYVVWNSR